ncbi:MAG: transglycosylase SLT domain-containing protein [Thermoanaerobaculia bacterium]
MTSMDERFTVARILLKEVLAGAVIAAGLLLPLPACQQRGEEQTTPAKLPATKTVAPPSKPKPLEGKAPERPSTVPIARDLAGISAAKTLKVLFTFNSTGYFVYRGETMGYEYELLSRYAAESQLRLVPVVVRDSRTLFDRLNSGEGDVVAAQLVTSPNENGVALTSGVYATAPVVVQRRDGAGTTPSPSPSGVTVRARLVSQPSELAGTEVHVSKSSPYRRQLLELNDNLGEEINVVEVDESTDKLIERLSEGEIGYTVAPENLAVLKATEYTNLVIRPALGPPQQVAWAVRRNAPQLLESLNRWIEIQKRKGLLGVLYRKYFLNRRAFTTRAKSGYLTPETGRLSPYDDWFRQYAKIPGWDWRLVASQAYQESRFNPNARSWAGAVGLMQIMPRTAKELHANPGNAQQAVEAACKYLWKLDEELRAAIPQNEQRLKFVLGAYNVGLGHIEDAQRLAKKHGNDPGAWEDVAFWLIQKSKRAVYNDPVVKYGFARGTEPVAYVDAILDRFEHYKAFLTADPSAPSVGAAAARQR